MTSATDYAILQNEANVNGGQAPVYADPYNLIDAAREALHDGEPAARHRCDVQTVAPRLSCPAGIFVRVPETRSGTAQRASL